MSDNISAINPFNVNGSFSAEEIAELDTNQDGVISESELKAKWSWLSEHSSDSESGVDFSTTDVYGASRKAGVGEKAATEDDFKSYMSTVADEYFENYMNSNLTLTETQRTFLQTLLTTTLNEFITEYLAENKDFPIDMKTAISSFQSKADKVISDNNSAQQSVQSSVDGYTDSMDGNLDSLVSLSIEANSNENISESEWKQIKNKAVQYLMGMLLSGTENTDLLSNLFKNYTKNNNYKAALAAIKELQSCNDPIKMQKLLTTAQNSLQSFVDTAGKEKTVQTVESYAESQYENSLTTSLNTVADKYLESIMTASFTDEQKAELKTIVSASVSKFTAKLAEDGKMTQYNDTQLQTMFSDYVNQQLTALATARNNMAQVTTELDNDYSALVSVSDAANSNNNVSNDEKSQIVIAATKLVMDQMISGMENIALLQGLNSSYQSSSDFTKLKSLIADMKSSTDADKIAEYQKEAETLLKTMLESYSGDQLVKAVDSTKPIEIDDAAKSKIISGSTISSDYAANASRSGGYGKQNDDSLAEIQTMAKADLQAIADSLKTQLQSQLGTNYNEADIQKYINDAINDTMALFTQNVSRRNGHGDYNTGSDETAFVFLRRSGTHKGRYTYNVQSLTNTFIEKFNETAKLKQEYKVDASKATYDKENVIADSLGNDYDRNKTQTVYGENDDNTSYAKLIEQAKSDLKKVGEAIKQSLIAEGCSVLLADSVIDECIESTITDMKTAFQYCQPSGQVSGGGLAATIGGAGGIYGVGSLNMVGADLAFLSAGGSLSAIPAASLAIPVAGLAVAATTTTLGVLSMTTNLFGATYGQHNSDAGFFFERKSNSHSGNWGYDTQTLTNLFLSKVDAKIAEEKEKKKDGTATETTT